MSATAVDPSATPIASGLPLIGSAFALLRDPLAYLLDQHAKHGAVFRVRAPGRRFFVLAGREANRFASREGRDAFLAGPFWHRLFARRACPHLIIGVDGEDHAILRKLHGKDLPRSLVDEHADGLIALTRTQLAATCGVHQPAVSLTRGLVSRHVHHILSDGGDPAAPETVEALLETFRWETNSLLLGKWPKLALRHPRYRQHRRRSEEFLEALIRECEQDPPKGWFTTILRGREELPHLFTDPDVRMGFMLAFVAGVDTVGATLAALLGELLRNAPVLAEIRSAVDQCWPSADEPPSVATLKNIGSLRGAVLEALRLHPSAFAVYRQAARGIEFAGHRIPAGADVLLFTTATHWDSAHFAEPHAFDVSRYAPPREEHRQSFVHMPYGVGPHICLGAGLGEALLLSTTATIIRFFDVDGDGLAYVDRHQYDPSLVVDRRARVRLAPRG